MSDSIDRLIKEIAAEHGLALSRDDPILILQTVNSRLLHDSQKAQEEMLNQYKQELEEMTTRWSNDTKDKTERILNAAMTASKEVMTKTLQDGASMVRKEIDNALIHAQVQLRTSQRLLIWSFAATAVTFLAIGIVAWVIFAY